MLLPTWAQARIRATTVAVVMTMEPVFAALCATAFGGEDPTGRMLAGGALILGAMYVSEVGPGEAAGRPARSGGSRRRRGPSGRRRDAPGGGVGASGAELSSGPPGARPVPPGEVPARGGPAARGPEVMPGHLAEHPCETTLRLRPDTGGNT